MLDVCCDLTPREEYVVMVKTRNECQPQPTCRHTVTSATMVCYAEVMFQSVNTLPAEQETSNASVVIWSGEWSTPSTTERNTAQSERVLTRLVVQGEFPDGRLYRSLAHHPCMDRPIMCRRCPHCTHNLFTHMRTHFAHGS